MSGIVDLPNGVANDQMTGNVDLGLLPNGSLAAANSDADSGDLINANCKGIKVFIDVTARASGTLTVTISGKDPASGSYYTILSSAAISTVSTDILTVFPGISASSNVSANDHLPRTFKVSWTISGGTVTGTIGACLLV